MGRIEVLQWGPVVLSTRAFQTGSTPTVIYTPAVFDADPRATLCERHDSAAMTSRLDPAARTVTVTELLRSCHLWNIMSHNVSGQNDFSVTATDTHYRLDNNFRVYPLCTFAQPQFSSVQFNVHLYSASTISLTRYSTTSVSTCVSICKIKMF